MNTDTYNLVIGILSIIVTLTVTLSLYFVNQARKDANNSVPPEVAKKLADALPPATLTLLIALVRGGLVLADGTPTPTDNELLHKVLDQLQPSEPATPPAAFPER